MGRKPTKNLNLPAGMRVRERRYGTYYYLDTGKQAGEPRKEIPLGSDYVEAVRKWAELTASSKRAGNLVTFRQAAERYQREVLPTKARSTQESNLRELAHLLKFFDDPPVPLDDIEPVHVRQYLDWRGQTAKVRANREKALFSHVWNFARSKGITNKANPCAGIKGYTEKGRDAYVEDQVFKVVYDAAEVPLQDAMDLAYLTAQRPADVLKFKLSDIKDGALWITQNKTGARLRVAIEGELAAVIDRIKTRSVTSMYLVSRRDGTPLSLWSLKHAVVRARLAAVAAHPEMQEAIKQFQFRDLRAKAATDKEEKHGIAAAQDQLGHSTPTMTQHYVRHRKGKLVTPTR